MGDYVRMLEYRKTFRKESDQAWSSQVYRIRHVIRSNPITFQIEDLDGEPIKGGFYFRQLIKVKPSAAEFVGEQIPTPQRTADIIRNRYESRIGRRVESETESEETTEEEPEQQEELEQNERQEDLRIRGVRNPYEIRAGPRIHYPR